MVVNAKSSAFLYAMQRIPWNHNIFVYDFYGCLSFSLNEISFQIIASLVERPVVGRKLYIVYFDYYSNDLNVRH
jgi:hypothetical protein